MTVGLWWLILAGLKLAWDLLNKNASGTDVWSKHKLYWLIVLLYIMSLGNLVTLSIVTERSLWVQLLAAQKPVNRPGLGKEKFAFVQMPAAVGVWVVDICRKADSPSSTSTSKGWELLQTELDQGGGGGVVSKQKQHSHL